MPSDKNIFIPQMIFSVQGVPVLSGILKSGQLQAFNTIDEQKVILGNVEIGEFVGEMAYINNEPRSAYIEALSDAQLIEVPIELVDKILFTRPAWSKSLMQTLSRRLKNANRAIVKN